MLKMFYKPAHILSRNILKNFYKVTTKNYSKNLHLTKNEIGDAAIVILNRPEALNAINVSMITGLYNTLKNLEDQKSLVILKGAGSKAFAAGRDLVEAQSKSYFFKYHMNYITYLNASINLINTYQIPIISFMNDAVRGSGAGLAVFSKYRIATEHTRFALPEVRIGLHPHAGATYFLNKTKGKLGYYLALTGNELKGSDAVITELATHYCETKNLQKLESRLLECSNPNDIQNIIETICEKHIPEFSLNPLVEKIDRCFCNPTVEQIISKLKEDRSSWANEIIEVMEKCSPSSLKVTLKSLQNGRSMNLKDCLIMESVLSTKFYDYPDMFEGSTNALRSKDDNPKWFPSQLDEVTEELVEKYFQPNIMASNDIQNELFTERYI